MILQVFNKKIKDERGAIQFIESSVVFIFILLMISSLVVICLYGLNNILENEILYNYAIDYINEKEFEKKVYLDRIDKLTNLDVSKINISDKDKTFSKSVTISVGNRKIIDISRVDFSNFINGVEYATYAINEIGEINIGGKSLSQLVKDKLEGIKGELISD